MDKDISQLFIESENRWVKYNNKSGKIIDRSINQFESVKIQKTVIKAKIRAV